MPLAYILDNLQNGSVAKRPTMGGYIKKVVTDAETGAFTLTYTKKNGTTYTYTWDGTAWTAPQTPIPVDAEFHAMIFAQDWQIVDEAELTEGTW